MDSATLLTLASLCAPAVSPSTALALVKVESGLDPYAIGVVHGALNRQPRDQVEATTTAIALRVTGWNFSAGLAQINVRNFGRLKLSMTDCFDPCKNLAAMQSVLIECEASVAQASPAQSALRQTLSCYHSGNLKTGFTNGYVGRVVRAARPTARAPP